MMSLPLLAAFLAGLLLASPSSVFVAAAQDPVLRTENLHLDCSACLAVAAVLGTRMNNSLKEAPGSYLVSHRLDRESSNRRKLYKTGELRGVEVLDNMCRDAVFKEHFLRLNPKTKVRGYHVLNHGMCKKASRPALLEGSLYPDAKSIGSWFYSKLNGILIPVAHFYNKHERESIGRAGFHKAPQAACTTFLDEHDEELTEIVREADWLSEVEEQLCGLDWGTVVSVTRQQIRAMQAAESKEATPDDSVGSDHDDDDSSREDASAVWKGLAKPVSNVCMDAAAVRASAERDQRRWFAWSYKRKQKRAAAREARRARQAMQPADHTTAASTAASKETEGATEAASGAAETVGRKKEAVGDGDDGDL